MSTLQIILRNLQQLRAMIEDLLEVSRTQTGKLNVELQRVSISEAILYAVNTLQGAAAAKGIVLRCDSFDSLPFAVADPTRLRQVLSILLDNAVNFTQSGGKVEVKAGLLERDPSLVLVKISDTG